MLKAGKWVVLVYGFVMLAGGVGGYAAKKSIPSLISGIVSAILLAVAFSMIGTQPRKGFGLSLAVAVGLTVVFIERAVKTAAEAASMGRNVGLAVLSACVAAYFINCVKQSQ